MRLPAIVAALVSLLACSPDDLAGVQPHHTGVTEVSHVIKVNFLEGSVRLEVTRELRNDTNEVRGFSQQLRLPDGAIATSLRLGRGATMLPAPLSTEEQVAAQWDLLTSPGDAEPVPVGKLQWAFDGELNLDLFGLPPHETVTVGYDVLVPPRYEAGVLSFDFPLQEDTTLQPRFERAEAEATVDGFVVHRQHFTQPVADVRWATSQLDTDRTVWRLEVDAAPQLEPAPVNPRVVFVIDASHSEGPEGIAAQLELLPPYLASTPDAQVEVVVTRRFSERLFGRFVPAADVASLLRQNADKLAPGNGSNLDDGAALAARALSEVGGPARIVLFTDEALRGRFSNEVTLAGLQAAPRETVVHVVRRTGDNWGSLKLARDDEASLAPIASASGGIFVRVDGHGSEDAAETLRHLVRPIRVDDFKVEAEAMEPLVDDVLDEGATLRLHGVDARPPEFVTVTGKIWAREFRRVVPVDASLAQRLPGLAVGERDLRSQLTDDEVRSAAFLSQAVSPFTAYLAAPPNAAPSTAGGLMLGGSYSSSSHCGGCSMRSRCGLRGGRVTTDLSGLLRRLLQPGISGCEAKLGEVAAARVTVESTADEVVDVTVDGTSPEMASCLTEAAWAVRLTLEFEPYHRNWIVVIGSDPER